MASVDGSKSVQESSDESSEFECGPCRYDGEKKEAIIYCLQCEDYLCSSCRSAHRKLPSSRNHHVVSGSSMPRRSTSHTETRSQNVMVKCSCNGKSVTIYCREHNAVVCEDCQRLKHRTCQNMSIDDASSQVKVPDKEVTIEAIEGLKEKVEKLKADRTDDNDKLEIQSSECRRKIKEYCQNLKQQIEKLEKTALDEVTEYETKQRNEIEQHTDTCSTALAKLDFDYQLINSTSPTDKNMLFIHNIQLKKTIDHIEKVLQDMESEVIKPNIDFECDETIINADAKSIGTVRTTAITTGRPVVADMSVKLSTMVNIEGTSDSNDPLITGSVFMPNGKLVLCDYNNNSAKVLSIDFNLKEQAHLSSNPWDIDIIADDEVVISLPSTKSLTFLKVFPKLQLGSSLQLDKVCRGVAVEEGSIFVSFDNGEVRIMDRAGNKLKNVYSSLKFSIPYYISVPKPDMLCVSNHTGNTVQLFNDGKELYTYKLAGLTYPLGMYIDGAENILICGHGSHNVHIIDSNGKHKEVFLTANDGLKNPYTVSFRSSDNTLVVGGGTGCFLLLHKLG